MRREVLAAENSSLEAKKIISIHAINGPYRQKRPLIPPAPIIGSVSAQPLLPKIEKGSFWLPFS